MGTSGFAASRVAALATRERKERVDLPELRETWLARARGDGPRSQRAPRPPRPRAGAGAWRCATIADGRPHRAPDDGHHARDRARRGRRRARRGERRGGAGRASSEIAARSGGHAGRRRRDARTAGALHDSEPARSRARGSRDRPRGSRGGRSARRHRARDVGARRCSRCALRRAAHARRHGGASPDRVVCVVGVAGAGKTTALRVLGDALERSGVPVLGAAPSGRAADELRAGDRDPGEDPPLPAGRGPSLGWPAARLRPGDRRGRDGRDAGARAGPAPGRGGRRQGDPGRRPGPASRGRRGRALRRALRSARRGAPHREPPPARAGRARRAGSAARR